ncbi:S8 family serine peptidase [Conexibacter sp. SYSU D00693]|uniref:S8 family serine peptidase n=1 Tax=Conexibacter sp. SYSU D00693 TaxID=2812560 RepID=UPI00196A65F3|nr:S8 family serine peptidase [Conexibacter sp. SYSU D00693]
MPSLTRAVACLATATCVLGAAATAAPAAERQERTYVVVLQQDASASAGRAAIERAGGRVVQLNDAVGVATVTSTNASFADEAVKSKAVAGAATDRAVGKAPADQAQLAQRREVERMEAARLARQAPGVAAPSLAPAGPLADPLTPLQWDMDMIDADASGSYATQQGSHDVRVGVIDTGIDGSHPDIAPNFDAQLSRNFTVDDPVIDGSCASDPDGSCTDPADVDEDGHGTHVAGTIGSPLNGVGIGGVAPKVSLVNLRAGQDSGYFFLQPVVNALTYAGDNGIDVVNMSFYIDPWLYNCRNNPADSPEAQAQQRTILTATQRALDYARRHGVTLIAAEGNGNTDLGRPTFDDSSPDYPPDAAYDRTIDNRCKSMPTEADGVIGVTSVGPSGRKAYYSDYGVEQADVSAPGGDRRDFPGTDRYLSPTNTILAPYPEALARANGEIDDDGTPNTPFVVRDCTGGPCSYYQYLQGTSMAAPHAVGVAALIIAQEGRRDRRHGGVTADPDRVEQRLLRTAVDTPCPTPRTLDYPDLDEPYTATCEGLPTRNGFYGDGIVNAARAVTDVKG